MIILWNKTRPQQLLCVALTSEKGMVVVCNWKNFVDFSNKERSDFYAVFCEPCVLKTCEQLRGLFACGFPEKRMCLVFRAVATFVLYSLIYIPTEWQVSARYNYLDAKDFSYELIRPDTWLIIKITREGYILACFFTFIISNQKSCTKIGSFIAPSCCVLFNK